MAKQTNPAFDVVAVGDTVYKFEPGRTLTLEEVTELFKLVVGNWRMTQDRYDALPEDLKDVFVPEKVSDGKA